MTAAHPAIPRSPACRRLTAVELRKMTDTRAGFWLLLVDRAERARRGDADPRGRQAATTRRFDSIFGACCRDRLGAAADRSASWS